MFNVDNNFIQIDFQDKIVKMFCLHLLTLCLLNRQVIDFNRLKRTKKKKKKKKTNKTQKQKDKKNKQFITSVESDS